MMSACWAKAPRDRPTFRELRWRIQQSVQRRGRWWAWSTGHEAPSLAAGRTSLRARPTRCFCATGWNQTS
eukprot:7131175-Pyramimonas_sp.AAC.2